MKLLVKWLTRIVDEATPSRYKSGLLNFIGGICKILFGSMRSEDATYSTDNISEQTDFLTLLKTGNSHKIYFKIYKYDITRRM